MDDKERLDAMTVSTAPYESDALAEGTVDAVVIGGGAAGLNGALILARSRRSVVVIDSGTPRNAPAEAMHGFIVLDGTPPPEILRRGREQVRQYGDHVVPRWPRRHPPPRRLTETCASPSPWPTAVA